MLPTLIILFILCLIFCPRKHDPAIRLKEFNEDGWHYKPKHDGFPEQLGGD